MTKINLGDAGLIDVLDFQPFVDGTAKQKVADALVTSLKDVGFVYLVNHGLAKEEIDEMFEWSKRFFDLPLEVKQLAPHPPSGSHHRGYSALGVEKIVSTDELGKNMSKPPDVKESFECGREDDEIMPNILLPDDVLPGFNQACLDFFWTCFELEKTILRALAVGLHLQEDFFLQYHTKPDNQLRLLHYPSVPVERLEREEVTRITAHADFGSITLLIQDAVGGLEIEDPKVPGRFQSAPPVEGAIIVNAGDFLMRWSNDLIRSTVHRVRAPPNLTTKDGITPQRYSIPYFCSADFSTVVDCIPGTYSDERPKKYEPISAKQYILQRLAANY